MASIPPIKPQPQFGVGEFGAVNVFDGLLGLRYAWGTTLGKTLPDIDAALAQLNKGAGTALLIPKAGQVNLFGTAGLKMLENIGQGLTHTQYAAVNRYITEAWAWEGVGAGIERLAEDVLQTHKVAKQRSLPGKIVQYIRPVQRADLRPALKRAAVAEKAARKAEAHAARLEKRVAHLERQIGHANDGIVVGLPPRVGVGEREREQIKAGLRKVSKYGTLAFLLALLAKALEKMGLNWIRCRGVNRVGRSLCGASGLIEALYAGAITAFAVTDLCRFAYGIERAAEAIRPVMLEWVDVENALLKCPSASYPTDFPLAAFSATPVVDAVLTT